MHRLQSVMSVHQQQNIQAVGHIFKHVLFSLLLLLLFHAQKCLSFEMDLMNTTSVYHIEFQICFLYTVP